MQNKCLESKRKKHHEFMNNKFMKYTLRIFLKDKCEYFMISRDKSFACVNKMINIKVIFNE